MNKKGIIGAVCLFLIISVFVTGCVNSPEVTPEKTTYIIGIDGFYPPFTYIDANGEAAGVDVESAKWIAEEEGFAVEFKPVTWNDIISALERGEIDMIYSGLTITPERAEVVDFSIPYWVVDQGVAVREDSGLTMADINSDKVILGLVHSSSADVWAQENIDEYDRRVAEKSIVIYNSFPMSVIGLQNKGCDMIISDDVGIKSYLQGKPLKQIGVIETGESYGVAVQKGNTELLDMINQAIPKLQASPKWQELIDKYIVNEIPDGVLEST